MAAPAASGRSEYRESKKGGMTNFLEEDVVDRGAPRLGRGYKETPGIDDHQ